MIFTRFIRLAGLNYRKGGRKNHYRLCALCETPLCPLWLKTNAPYCGNPENIKQLTENELLELIKTYDKTQLKKTILNLEKSKRLREKCTNLYETLKERLEKANKEIKF
jgi:hypothetical protein